MKGLGRILQYAACAYFASLLAKLLFNGFSFRGALLWEAIPMALGLTVGWALIDFLQRRKEK